MILWEGHFAPNRPPRRAQGRSGGAVNRDTARAGAWETTQAPLDLRHRPPPAPRASHGEVAPAWPPDGMAVEDAVPPPSHERHDFVSMGPAALPRALG